MICRNRACVFSHRPYISIMENIISPSSTYTLHVQGMHCTSCVGRIERSLAKIPDVQAVNVNLATEQAVITANGALDLQAIATQIEALGFSTPTTHYEFDITGMHCASCVGRVERVLEKVSGVIGASVNLATEKAHVEVLGNTSVDQLIKAIEVTGFGARLATDTAATDDQETIQDRHYANMRVLKRDLLIALIVTLPVFLIEMGGHFIPAIERWIDGQLGTQNSWVLQFILTTIVMFGPGFRFFKLGLPALWRRAPDMNSLVALGTAAAYGYSVIATFFPTLLPEQMVNVYFEAAAVIVTLILLGRMLEARARGRSSQAIQQLIKLQPRTARLKKIDGSLQEITIDKVKREDVLVIRPGERVPVDGSVLDGNSYIDESMISGEPVPVEKSSGDAVIGGTINQNGALTIKAEKVGRDTVLAQIISMVEQAQGAKLPIQLLVDKVTMWFVPIVMLVAVLTFIVWLIFGPAPALTLALVNSVAVLIIACPCAMGLATPTSIMVGTGRGAQLGVLFRKGEALQRLRSVAVVAVDKTGTLTEGRPELTDLMVATGFERNDVLAAIAAVENQSEHPIAQAIVAAAEQAQLTLPALDHFESITGFGVRATVDGRQVNIGADRYMAQLGLDVAVFAETAQQLGDEGKSPLYAAIDGKLAAILAVADPIKETTPAAIDAMHALGLKVVMVTGDNQRTAKAIAQRLGIDEVVAEVLPEGKVTTISSLKSRYGALAFVGDGINDAPALANADVGISIGTGTDIAIEAADVVLMTGHLTAVPHAIALSRATIRNIRQNLFWAFAYNAALIPVAAGVLYPLNGTLLSPIFAAGAMALSSVFVVTNALRLRRFQPAAAA